MPSFVTVWTRWGDYVLGVRDVRPGESLSVGARLLVGFQGPTAHLNGGQALGEGETSSLSLDGLEYTLTCFADEAKGFARPRQPLWLFGAAALLLGLQLLSRLSVSPPVAELAPLLALSSSARPTPLYQLAEPMPDAFPVVVGGEPRVASAVTGGSKCGDAEMGMPASAQTAKRYGVRGPRDNADPHLARPQPDDRQANGLELPSAQLGSPRSASGANGPMVRWGREAALGSDERAAWGQMWFDELGPNHGEGGLGRQGWPGSVGKRLEVAATRDAPAQQLRVLHTGLRVSGGRKMSEVGRSMAAHFEAFRQCAEYAGSAQLSAVELDFEVTPDGHATAIGQAQSGLEQCLDQSLTSIPFPAGAAALVHYPLYFVTAEAEPPPRAPRPARLEACDCG